MMYQNGSVSNNVKYLEICSDLFVANVAYFARIWVVNSTMRVYKGVPHMLFIGARTQVPYTNEIMLPFFKNHNVFAIGINSNYGYYDFETERFTGCVGEVNNDLKFSVF